MQHIHLKPINLRGRPERRRPLKKAPSLSCDYPEYSFPVKPPVDPVELLAVSKERELAAV